MIDALTITAIAGLAFFGAMMIVEYDAALAENARLRAALEGVVTYLKETGNFCECGKPDCRSTQALRALAKETP
jgi:hypothetical protein